MKSYAKNAFVVFLDFCNFLFEKRTMFGRYGKMNVHLSVFGLRIFDTFDDMLFQRSSLDLAIFVEFQQGFGQCAIAEILLFQKEIDHGCEVAAIHVVSKIERGAFHAVLQVVEEREGAYVLEEFLHARILVGEVLVNSEVGGRESVKVFEHA